jgi:phosphoribosylglycinamide formyltransferase-1
MLRIGGFASHEGTTLQSIIDACVQGRIDGRVVVVISNNSRSGALRRAAAADIETFTLAAFPKRILKTHPALLPKFGGQGMFGDRVFEAVLAVGEPESGASVRIVDAEYDTGAVVRQERVRVLPADTVESLKAPRPSVRARSSRQDVDCNGRWRAAFG